MKNNKADFRHKILSGVAKVTLLAMIFAIIFAGTLSGAFGIESLAIEQAQLDGIEGNVSDTVGVADAENVASKTVNVSYFDNNPDKTSVELTSQYSDYYTKRAKYASTSADHASKGTWNATSWNIGDNSWHTGTGYAHVAFDFDFGKNWNKLNNSITITLKASVSSNSKIGGYIFAILSSTSSFGNSISGYNDNNTFDGIKVDSGISYYGNGDGQKGIKTFDGSNGNKKLTGSLTLSHTIKGQYVRIALVTYSTTGDYGNVTATGVSIKATREMPSYQIAYNANSNGSGTVGNTNHKFMESSDITSNVFTGKDGYYFDRYETKADGTGIGINAGGSTGTSTSANTFGALVKSNLEAGTTTTTLYAQYKNVQFKFNGGGNASSNGTTYTYGDTIPTLLVLQNTTGYFAVDNNALKTASEGKDTYTSTIKYSSNGGSSWTTTVPQAARKEAYKVKFEIYKSGDNQLRGSWTVDFKIVGDDFGRLDSGTSGIWGSATNPFVIATNQHLTNLANIVSGTSQPLNSVKGINAGDSTNTLATNITYSGCYFVVIPAENEALSLTTPIGNSSHKFSATFYGGTGTYTVDNYKNRTNVEINLNITVDAYYAGLFGYTDGATIENITVTGNGITAKGVVGGIVGYANNTKIHACENKTTRIWAKGPSTKFGSLPEGGAVMGGIAGYLASGEISHCYSQGTITTLINPNNMNSGEWGGTNFIGGIVGFTNGDVSYCYAQNNIHGSHYIGGIVGLNYNNSHAISYCYFNGTLYGLWNSGGALVGYISGNGAAEISSSNTNLLLPNISASTSGANGGTGSVTYKQQAPKVTVGSGVTIAPAYVGTDGNMTYVSSWESIINNDIVGICVYTRIENGNYLKLKGNTAIVSGDQVFGSTKGSTEANFNAEIYFTSARTSEISAEKGTITLENLTKTYDKNSTLPTIAWGDAKSSLYINTNAGSESPYWYFKGNAKDGTVYSYDSMHEAPSLAGEYKVKVDLCINGVVVGRWGDVDYIVNQAEIVVKAHKRGDTSTALDLTQTTNNTYTYNTAIQGPVELVLANAPIDGIGVLKCITSENFDLWRDSMGTTQLCSMSAINANTYSVQVVFNTDGGDKVWYNYTLTCEGANVASEGSTKNDTYQWTINPLALSLGWFKYQGSIVANNVYNTVIPGYPLSVPGDSEIALIYQDDPVNEADRQYTLGNFIVYTQLYNDTDLAGNSLNHLTLVGSDDLSTVAPHTMKFRAYIGDSTTPIANLNDIRLEANHVPHTFKLRLESLDSNYTIGTVNADTGAITENQIVYTLLVSDFGGDYSCANTTEPWGSAKNPFVISTIEHLLRLSQIVNGGVAWNSINTTATDLCATHNTSVDGKITMRTYQNAFFEVHLPDGQDTLKVTKDMGFVPIGGHDIYGNSDDSKYFSGTFYNEAIENANGTKTIKNYTIRVEQQRTDDYVGLFGILNGAIVKDTNIVVAGGFGDVVIDGTTYPNGSTSAMVGANYVGAVAGYAINSTIINVTTGKDHSQAEASWIEATGDYVGGIVGYYVAPENNDDSYEYKIEHVYANLYKYIGKNYVGGIVGYSKGGTIINPNIAEDGDAQNDDNGVNWVGGVAGKIDGTQIVDLGLDNEKPTLGITGRFFTGYLRGEKYVGSIAGAWTVTHGNQVNGTRQELGQGDQNMFVMGDTFVGGLVGYFDASACKDGLDITPKLIGANENAHNSMNVYGANYVGALFGVFIGGGYKKDSVVYDGTKDTRLQIAGNVLVGKDVKDVKYSISATVNVQSNKSSSANVVGGLFGYISNAGIVFTTDYYYEEAPVSDNNTNPVIMKTSGINDINFLGMIAGIMGENSTIENTKPEGGPYNEIIFVTANEYTNANSTPDNIRLGDKKNDFVGRIAGYVASNAGIKNGDTGTMFGNRMIAVVAGDTRGNNYVGGLFGAIGKVNIDNNIINDSISIPYSDKNSTEYNLLYNALRGRTHEGGESTTTLVFGPRAQAVGETAEPYGRIANRGGIIAGNYDENDIYVDGGLYVGGIVGAVLDNARLEFVNPQYDGKKIGDDGNSTNASASDLASVYDGNYKFNGYHTYIISGGTDTTSQINGGLYVGGIAGWLGSGAHLLQRVVSRINFNNDSATYVGGIAGYMQNGTIENCMTPYTGRVTGITFDSNVYHGASYVGGIVGYLEAGKVVDSVSTGMKFDGFADSNNTVGGVVGSATQNAKVENSWAIFVSTRVIKTPGKPDKYIQPDYTFVPANEWGKFVVMSSAIQVVPNYIELARMIGLYNFETSQVANSTNASLYELNSQNEVVSDYSAQYGELSIAATVPVKNQQLVFFNASGRDVASDNTFSVFSNKNSKLYMRLKAFGDGAQNSMIVSIADVKFANIAPFPNSNYTDGNENAEQGYVKPSNSNKYSAEVTNAEYKGLNNNVTHVEANIFFNGELVGTASNVQQVGAFKGDFTPGASAESPYIIASQQDWDDFAWNVYTGKKDYAGEYVKLTVDGIQINATSHTRVNDFKKTVADGEHGHDDNEDGYGKFDATSNNGYNFAGNISQGFDAKAGLVTIDGAKGAKTASFKGTFDGDGHTLNVNVTASWNRISIFPNAEGATFKNLTIAGDITAGNNYKDAAYDISAFVSKPFGNITFENCTNATNITALRNVGGLVGYVDSGYKMEFIGCVNTGNIKSFEGSYTLSGRNNATYSYDDGWGNTGYSGGTGGLIGTLKGALTIESCRNAGNVTGGHNVGGIIGLYDDGLLKVNSCGNTGNILANSGYTAENITARGDKYNVKDEGGVNGNTSRGVRQSIFGYVGGIIGKTGQSATLEMYYSYNSADVTTYANMAGGLVGAIGTMYQPDGDKNAVKTGGNSIVAYCYNIGTVRAGGTYPKIVKEWDLGRENYGGSLSGGIAGLVGDVLITQSYNAGDIYSHGVIGYMGSWQLRSGGIVGQSQPTSTGKVEFSYIYNVGTVACRAHDSRVLAAVVWMYMSEHLRYGGSISGYCDTEDAAKRISSDHVYSIKYPVSVKTVPEHIDYDLPPENDSDYNWGTERRGDWLYDGGVANIGASNGELVVAGSTYDSFEQLTAFMNSDGTIKPRAEGLDLAQSTSSLTETISKSNIPSGWLYVYGCLPQLAAFALGTQNGLSMRSVGYGRDTYGNFVKNQAGGQEYPFLIRDGIDMLGMSALTNLGYSFEGKYIEFANADNNLDRLESKYIEMPTDIETPSGGNLASTDTYKAYNGAEYKTGKSYHLFSMGALCNTAYKADGTKRPTSEEYDVWIGNNCQDIKGGADNASSATVGAKLGEMNYYPAGMANDKVFAGNISGKQADGNTTIRGLRMHMKYITNYAGCGYVYAGLFGRTQNGTISYITVDGNITATGESGEFVMAGGIVGLAGGGTTIDHCKVEGIIIEAISTGSDEHSYVGGIVGIITNEFYNGTEKAHKIGSHTTVSNCEVLNNCAIKAHLANAGGIAGYASATRKEKQSDDTYKTVVMAGSFVDIENCKVNGATIQDSAASTAVTNIGGIIATNDMNIALTIKGCSVGDSADVAISGSYALGGVIGSVTGNTRIENTTVGSNTAISRTKNGSNDTYGTAIGGFVGYSIDGATNVRVLTFGGQLVYAGSITIGNTGTSLDQNVGGIIGYMGSGAVFEDGSDVVVSGSITFPDDASYKAKVKNIGGVAGITKNVEFIGQFDVQPTMALGSATTIMNIGGFIGLNDGICAIIADDVVTTSTGEGEVSTEGGTIITIGGTVGVDRANNVGGFIGNNDNTLNIGPDEANGVRYYGTALTITISGQITGNDNVGGFVGNNEKKENVNGGINIQKGDIQITGGLIQGHDNVGGIIGNNTDVLTTGGSNVQDATLSIINKGEVNGHNNVGGVFGNLENANIADKFTNKGKVTAIGNNIGGVIGYMKNSTIYGGKFTNSGTVTATLKAGDDNVANYVGGVVGYMGENSEITGGEFSNTGAVSGNDYVGGTVGGSINESTTSVNVMNGETLSAKNTGTVSGRNNVGGVFGYVQNTEIAKLFTNGGKVTATGNNVGGVIGFMKESTIYGGEFKNIGDVEVSGAVDGDGNKANYVGGVIGNMNANSKITGGKFENSGSVVGGMVVGGSIGLVLESAQITNKESNQSIQFVNGKSVAPASTEALTADDGATSADYMGIVGYRFVGGSIGVLSGTVEGIADNKIVFDNLGTVGGYDNKNVYYVGGSVAVLPGTVKYSVFSNRSDNMTVKGANVVGGSIGFIGKETVSETIKATVENSHFEFTGILVVEGSTGGDTVTSGENVGIGGSIGVIKSATWTGNTFYSSGQVTATAAEGTDGAKNIGGSIGLIAEDNIKISNMLAYETTVIGRENVGGVVGATTGANTVIENSFNVRGTVEGINAGGIIGSAIKEGEGATNASTSYWVKAEDNFNLEKSDITDLNASLGKNESVIMKEGDVSSTNLGINLSDTVSSPIEYINNKINPPEGSPLAGTQTPTERPAVGATLTNNQYELTITYETIVTFTIKQRAADGTESSLSVTITVLREDVETYERIVETVLSDDGTPQTDESGNEIKESRDTLLSTVTTYSYRFTNESGTIVTGAIEEGDGTDANLGNNNWDAILKLTALNGKYTYTNGYYVYTTSTTTYSTGEASTGWYFVYAKPQDGDKEEDKYGYINALHTDFVRTGKDKAGATVFTFGGTSDAIENDRQAWKYIAKAYTAEENALILKATVYSAQSKIVSGGTFSADHVYATATKGKNTIGSTDSGYYLYMATSGTDGSGNPIRPAISKGSVDNKQNASATDKEDGYFIDFVTYITGADTRTSVQNIAIYYRKLQYKQSVVYNGYERIAPILDNSSVFTSAGYDFTSFVNNTTPVAAGDYTSDGIVNFNYTYQDSAGATKTELLPMSDQISFAWKITKKEVVVTTDRTNGGNYGDSKTVTVKIEGLSPNVGTRINNDVGVVDDFHLVIGVYSKKAVPGNLVANIIVNKQGGSYVAQLDRTTSKVTIVNNSVPSTPGKKFGASGASYSKVATASTTWDDVSFGLKFVDAKTYVLKVDLTATYDTPPTAPSKNLVNYRLKETEASVKVEPKELSISIVDTDRTPSGRLYDGQPNDANAAWEIEGWYDKENLDTEFVDDKGTKTKYFKLAFAQYAYYSLNNTSYAELKGSPYDAPVKTDIMSTKNYVVAGKDVFTNVGYYAIKVNGTKSGDKLVVGNYYFSTKSNSTIKKDGSGYYSKDAYVIGKIEIVITADDNGSLTYGDNPGYGESSFTFQIREQGKTKLETINDYYKGVIADNLKIKSNTYEAKTFDKSALTSSSTSAKFTLKTPKTPSDAGTYSAELEKKIDSNNVLITFTDGKTKVSFTIDKRPLNFDYSFTSGGSGTTKSYEYNTNHQGVNSVTINNLVGSDKVNISLSVTNGSGWTGTKSGYTSSSSIGTTATDPIRTSDVGNYTLTVTGVGGDKGKNYKIGTGSKQIWSITPKELSLSVAGGTSVYDGKPKTPSVNIAGSTGNVFANDTLSFEWAITDSSSNVLSQMVDVGTYAITYNKDTFAVTRGGKDKGDNNQPLKNNYDVSVDTNKCEYTITPAHLTLTWSSNTLHYNGHAQGQIVTGGSTTPSTSNVSISGSVLSVQWTGGLKDDLSVTLSGQERNAGTHTMYATIGGDRKNNYEIVNCLPDNEYKVAHEYTIKQAKVSWTATANVPVKTYDATNAYTGGFTLTWSDVEGEYASSMNTSGKFSVSGHYSDKNVGNNKVIVCEVTNKDTANIVIVGTSANAQNSGTIKPAELTISLDKLRNNKATKAYDGDTTYGGEGFTYDGSTTGRSKIYRSGEGFSVMGFPDAETNGTVKFVAKYVETTANRSQFDKFVNDVVVNGSEYSILKDKTYYKKLVFTMSGENSGNYTFKVKVGSIEIDANGLTATIFDKDDTANKGDQNSGINIEITVKALKANYSNTAQSYANADNTYNTDWLEVTGQDATKAGLTINVVNGWMYENGVDGAPKQYEKYTVIRGRVGSSVLSASIATRTDGTHINYRLSNQPILTIGYFVDTDDFPIGSMASLMIAAYYQQASSPEFNQPVIATTTWHPIVSAADYGKDGSFESNKPADAGSCTTWDEYFAQLETAGKYVFLNTAEGTDANGEWGYYEVSEGSGEAKKYTSFKQVANVDGILTQADINILDNFFALYTFDENGEVTSTQRKEWGKGKTYIQNFLKVGVGNVSVVLGSIFTGDFTGTFDGNGYTINHVNIMGLTGDANVGMFAKIASTGTVKNVNLRNFSIIANCANTATTYNVGGIAGQSASALENCTFHGSITVNGASTAVNVGGIAGSATANVTGAIVLGNIDVTSAGKVGGVVGYANGIILDKVVSMIEIFANGNVGAVVGNGSVTATNVYYLANSAYTKGLVLATGSVGTAKTYTELMAGSNSGYNAEKGAFDVIENTTIVVEGENKYPAARESMHLQDLVKVYLLMYSQADTAHKGYLAVSDKSWLVGTADGTTSKPIVIANQQDVSLLRQFRFATFTLANNVEMYSTRPNTVFDGVFYGTVQANGHKIYVYKQSDSDSLAMFEKVVGTALPIEFKQA